jgi:hypothetical protein
MCPSKLDSNSTMINPSLSLSFSGMMNYSRLFILHAYFDL